METSQSSDCLSEDATFSMNHESMDTDSYKSLIALTEEALSSDVIELQVDSFASLLKDCSTCINQSLHVVTVLLSETEICVTKLVEYLNDAVRLLELLSNFIETVIGSASIICCATKTFPASVGFIILTVFSHCKNGKSQYESNLSSVQGHVKDLFINCHKLQTTYLMVLQNHFVFDPTHTEEKRMLLEALDINMRIGETVHTLDTKALASQWRGLTAIFKKYSHTLSDTSMFQDCLVVLCSSIRSNIKTANEANYDSAVGARSLKAGCLLVRALLRTCEILGQATRKDFNNVLSLLFYINKTSAHLQMTDERSQFINFIASPSECLLKELLYDETFANSLLKCNLEKIKQEGSFLGYVLTVTSVMDYLTKGLDCRTVSKSQLIHSVYNILPHCNSWNLDVTLWSGDSSHGLFEHLLVHVLALALSLNSDEYILLEKNMVEAILSTNHVSAIFSTNIWTLLHMTNDINSRLLLNQIVWLCTMYKKLEKQAMFPTSPQKIHLTHTITRLFTLMENDDKDRICKQFRIHDDDNLALWAALGVKNLPHENKKAAEAVVAEKLKMQFQCLNGNGPDMDKLITVMTLAATCTFSKGSGIEDYIMKAWCKTCPKRQLAARHVLRAAWFRDYLQALIALTDSMWHQLCLKNVNLIKILHCVTSLIQQCGVEFKLLFINILCKIATTDICESKLDDFTASFTCLFQTSGDIVQNKLCTTLKLYTHDNIDRILCNGNLRDSWSKIKNGPDSIDATDIEFKYAHKCVETGDMTESSCSNVTELKRESSGNFDFPDKVDLFRNGGDLEESACKKFKLESPHQAEAIIKRLETEAALLCVMKDNVFSAECRSRIRNVCDDLNSIIN